MPGPSRRAVLGAVAGLAFCRPVRAKDRAGARATTIRIGPPTGLVSPLVYGSNEIGTMDGGRPSADLDRAAGVAMRRLGGNLTTTLNWWSGNSNAGHDDKNRNGPYLPDALGLTEAERREPAAVVMAMHRSSGAMGARSLVTLPLAGFVAADRDGEVGADEAAPSRRFVPVRWSGDTPADAPVDRTVADIPHLLHRLVRAFGSAANSSGIRAYALDNEPGLWAENHPRVVPRPVRIADLVARAVEAAAAIKRIDPAAWVVGPASWGATGMASLQNAPDRDRYRDHGSFLAAYLDAFRQASEAAGHRLLDALDVHWYPFSARGPLFRTEDPALAEALLQAPRSLDEPGFREDSWVSRALPVSLEGGLALPLLPSLERIAARWFPGTGLAVTEFNYGGAGQLASGLALVDALGRLGRPSLLLATHWGSLDGWLGQAYRLYRDYDGCRGRFGARRLATALEDPTTVSAAAALGPEASGRLHVIATNKTIAPQVVDLVLADGIESRGITAFGFDADHLATGLIDARKAGTGRVERLALPPRSARHLVIDIR